MQCKITPWNSLVQQVVKISYVMLLNKSIFFSNTRLQRFILSFDSCIASIK